MTNPKMLLGTIALFLTSIAFCACSSQDHNHPVNAGNQKLTDESNAQDQSQDSDSEGSDMQKESEETDSEKIENEQNHEINENEQSKMEKAQTVIQNNTIQYWIYTRATAFKTGI